MSVFDKFLSANPYVRTYVGAPIEDAVQVAQVLQQRHDKALTDMTQHEYVLNNIPGVSDADKRYKEQYAANLAQEFDKLREAPEMAQQAIDALASKYKNDPVLNNMKAYAAKKAEWTKKFQDNPEKYGPEAMYAMRKAVERYEADGGAQGATFTAPPLYEKMDENKFLRENAALIKASSNGKFIYNEAKGTIETISGEGISFERAQQVLKDAMLGDATMRGQLQREFGYMKDAQKYKGDFNDFLNAKTQGMSLATAYQEQKFDAKGWDPSKGSSYAGNISGGEWGAIGGHAETTMVKPFKNIDDLKKRRRTRGKSAADLRATVKEDKIFQDAVNEWEQKGGDPRIAAFIRQKGIDFQRGGLVLKRDGDWGVFSPMTSETDSEGMGTNPVVRYAQSEHGMDIQKATQFARDVFSAYRSVWDGDIGDRMEEANRVAYQTEWHGPIETFGNRADGKETIAKMNESLNMAVNSMSTISGVVKGVDEQGPVEFTREDFDGLYEKGSLEVTGWETRGSNQISLKAKRIDGQGYDEIIMNDLDELTMFNKNIEAVYANRAQQYPLGSSQRSKYTQMALAMGEGQLLQQVVNLDNQEGQRIDSIPLDFGTMDSIIQSDFGQVNLGKDQNGNYLVTINGERQFDEDSPTGQAIRNAPNAQAAYAELMQHLQRHYGAKQMMNNK